MNHDDFDQFLQQSADGLKMRPSDKVWSAIATELERKKKRSSGLFVLALLMISGTYIAFELAQNNNHSQTAYQVPITQQELLQPADLTRSLQQEVLPSVSYRFKKSSPKAAPAQQLAAANNIEKAPSSLPLLVDTLATTAMQQGQVAAVDQPAALALAAPAERDLTMSLSPDSLSLATAASTGFAEAEQAPSTQPEPATTTALPKPLNKAPQISWQVFATPTISYRILSDNKSYRRPLLSPAIPANFSALYGINDMVIHKPDLGLEFGVVARYPLSRSVNLRTGFQINVSRYDIKAFSYVPEVATIALNNGPRVDSVRAISNYRNFAGGIGDWLQNFYLQASIPIGLEWKVATTRKMHWSVASSIQPSYLLGNRSYMITADYKNYARIPWLTRRWNMHSSFETFVSFNSGKTQWQIGPQVRYQLRSSFINKYPVKENLFDFGMKVGITLK